MRAAEVSDIMGEKDKPPHDVTAESQHFIDDVANLVSVTHEVPQIDQTIPFLEMLINHVMDRNQTA